MSDAHGDTAETKTRDYLKDEYLKLLDNYESFDSRSLTIKGWVATGAVTALALSFGKDIPEAAKSAAPVFVAALTITFWGLETAWKLFQSALQDRIRTIEAYFRNDQSVIVYAADGSRGPELKDLAPLQTFNSWSRSLRKDLPIYEYETYRGIWRTDANNGVWTFERPRFRRVTRIAGTALREAWLFHTW